MRYTTFGRTGLRVSRLSMGCNRLGDPGVDPAQWPPIVRRALDLGVTFFDTSNSYNQGRSEAILGEVTAAHPEVVIATKGGVPVETNDFPNRDFSAETILAAAEDSLRRLRRDTIDLYMLHSPTVEQLERQTWGTAIERLRSAGKIRSFGISTHDHASGIWAIRHGAEFLQIEYDILDPSAEDELLPLAREQNVGIMVRTPLARGLLSGKFKAGQPIPAEQQWRRPTGDRLQLRLQRVEQLRFLEREGQTLARAALRWLLAQPGVHCVIPGARTVEQLEDNVRAIDGDLSAEELTRVRELQQEWRAEGRW
ncbi:MAG: aldo/keto reductase [Chloroflexota bacterium]|nr:aldo/keto reductase [Chloroflexota bacterium]